jgi:hypothetical protein
VRRVWKDLTIPAYLDEPAKRQLVEAQTMFDRLGLRGCTRRPGGQARGPAAAIPVDRGAQAEGTRACAGPGRAGARAARHRGGHFRRQEAALIAALYGLSNGPPPGAATLAALVENKEVEKFDPFPGDELLTLAWGEQSHRRRLSPGVGGQAAGIVGADMNRAWLVTSC